MNKSYDEVLIEQYKIYVDSAEKVSSRRNSANILFLTINSFSLSLLQSINTFKSIEKLILSTLLDVSVILVLILMNFFWLKLIKSYRQLNTAKFKVIGELEKELPKSPYYGMEWKELAEGKDSNVYTPLTKIEQLVPKLLIFMYIAIILIICCISYNK